MSTHKFIKVPSQVPLSVIQEAVKTYSEGVQNPEIVQGLLKKVHSKIEQASLPLGSSIDSLVKNANHLKNGLAMFKKTVSGIKTSLKDTPDSEHKKVAADVNFIMASLLDLQDDIDSLKRDVLSSEFKEALAQLQTQYQK